MLVKEDDLEGDSVFINQLKNLTVDVLVYDNHVQLAKSLKVKENLSSSVFFPFFLLVVSQKLKGRIYIYWNCMLSHG